MALSASPHPRDLTDEQWDFIGPFLPELTRRKDGRGRPWRENGAVFSVPSIFKDGYDLTSQATASAAFRALHERGELSDGALGRR